MKITEFCLHEYGLKLKQPMIVGEHELYVRRGYVIELRGGSDGVGFGEVAPLDGYSDEILVEVKSELSRLRHALCGYEIPENLEELSGGFDRWLGGYNLSASVRFGFESAVLSLIAIRRNLSLAQLLSDNPLRDLPVNALLSGQDDQISDVAQAKVGQGYTRFKLKVGRRSIDEDVRLTTEVRDIIGPDATLRLDANRRWTLTEYEKFAHGVRDCEVDYIEEPVSTLSSLKNLLKHEQTPLPLALDESLREMTPETLNDWAGIKAVVLKPTMLGLERSARFARAALRLGMIPVFSSSYESSLGLTTIAQIAAAFGSAGTPIGLDTVGIFQEDLLSPSLPIHNGTVTVGELPGIARSINRKALKETADA